MTHVCELIRGDKRNPSKTLDLAAGVSTGSIFLREGGFSPGAGAQGIIWANANPMRDGQKRITSNRGNAQVSLTYDLNGGSVTELGWLQREVNRFFQDAGLYEEDAQGEPIWLRYRWSDGLDIPEPVFGQYSHFLRILAGDVAKWPSQLHTGALVANQIEGIVADMVCKPHPEGLKQLVGTGIGQLEMKPNGLLMAQAVTNLCTNPSFGHSTWNTGWSVSNASLLATQETRAGFTRSLDSAVHLRNQDTSNARDYKQSLTLTAVDHIISCYARRADGAAVTSADMVMLGQGAAQSTTFDPIDGGPWYRAYATYTGVAAAANHGIEVKVGREIYVDDVQIEVAGNYTHATPFCAGYLIGCAWASTAHASNSSRPAGVLKWTLANELSGEFTVSGWIHIPWANTTSGDVHTIFDYYVDGNDQLTLQYDASAGEWQLNGARNSIAIVEATAASLAAGSHHVSLNHFAEGLIVLYVDGSGIASYDLGIGFPAAGVLRLGNEQAETTPLNGELDAWRIWDRALSATDVSNLYNAETEVKSAYGILGMPPAFWTGDGDDILDNVLDSTYTDYGILVGVPGDVEALTRWEIDPQQANPPSTFWLGRKATDKPIDASILWAEFQGTVDANSSEGEYNVTAAGVSDFNITSDITTYLKYLQGRYQYLVRFRSLAESVVVTPAYHFLGANVNQHINFDAVTIAALGSFGLYNLGDIIIKYPNELDDIPKTLRLKLAVDRTASTEVRYDFLLLLPHPFIAVQAAGASYTPAAGQAIIIEEDRAWTTFVASTDNYIFNLIAGGPVNALPDKYNYIYHLQADEEAFLNITFSGKLAIYVTPRFLLPGGPIA